MKIQRLLFPSVDTCTQNDMYYRMRCAVLHMESGTIAFGRNAEIETSTYFNGFSIGKWSRYTTLGNLSVAISIKGRFTVQILHVRRMDRRNIARVVSETAVNTDRKEIVRIPIPVTDTDGIYYFWLHCEGGSGTFFGGFYETDVDEDALPPVHIAIGICTYRREEYVAHNVSLFNEWLINNEQSPLYGNLDVFISDNGKSLPESIRSEHVRVFPNKNVGGSGGFTRTMIEVMKVRETEGITHILLIDDDVQIEPHSYELLYCFLWLIKQEHRDAFISGAMLRLDYRNIQSDNGAIWNGLGIIVPKVDYNLEDFSAVLANEIEDSDNYLGWWCCCMPVGVLREDNLPLPLFIKRDDIEYCLRCGTIPLTDGSCRRRRSAK